MKKPLVARKKSYEDSDKDLYQTPKIVTEGLLNRIYIENTADILEPANGLGAISDVIENYGYQCDKSDIRDGVDFLTAVIDKEYDWVITNPPYKYAQEFVEKALSVCKAGGKVAMLLKLSFLESAKRYHFFKNSGLKTVYVSSKRITMFPANGDEPKNSGTIAFAWFVWEKGYTGSPEIEWFNLA